MKKSLINFLLSITVIAVLVVACGDDSPITSSQYNPIDGGNTDNPNVPDNPWQGNDWENYRIWVPFAAKNSDGYNSYVVDYKDTNALKKLWLQQLQRQGETDGKYLFIRNGNNTQSIENFQSNGEYYLFNNSGDMYYKKLNLLIKEFVGAVVVKTRNGSKDGMYTVGGLYRIAVTRDEYMAIARTNNDNQSFRKVMSPDYYYHYNYPEGSILGMGGSYDRQGDMERQKGDLDVMVLNIGYSYNNNREFGFDSYLYYGGGNRDIYNISYITNEKAFLGQRPEFIDTRLDFTINYSYRAQNKNGQAEDKRSFKDYNFAFLPGDSSTAMEGITDKKTIWGKLPRWN